MSDVNLSKPGNWKWRITILLWSTVVQHKERCQREVKWLDTSGNS